MFRNQPSKTFAIVAFGLAVVFATAVVCPIGSASAQTSADKATAGFATTLQANDRQLESIESSFSQIEAAKTSAEKDKFADALIRRVDAYAKAMIASFNTALKQADLANKSQGKEGSTELLKSFEDLALRHEKTLKDLDERGQKIKPRSGLLILQSAYADAAAFGWRMLQKIGDAVISPAEAAIAASVYSACHQNPPNQTACAAAIANGTTQTSAAWGTYNDCKNRAVNKPKWLRAIQIAACATGLVIRLA